MRFPQSLRDTAQTSPGKLDRLPRTPAGYTGLALDGYGLRDQPPARPTKPASYPVPVRQVAVLIHASFRHPLARVSLRFTNPSPPSGWIEDFHSQAIEHAGHTAAPARAAGHGGDPVHTGARPGEQRRSAIDWRRSWRLLQWQATLPFELGVAPTVASLRPDARTPAQGCDGPARVSGPTAGQVSGAGWRQ